MTYPKYATPNIIGITMAVGAGSQQPIYNGVLSYKPDAQALAAAIGATLVNAANTPSLGVTFGPGLRSTDGAQPWVVISQNGGWDFAGITILRRAQKSSGWTVAGPGSYVKDADGTWDWAPAPNPAPVLTPAPSSAGDPDAFNAAQNVPTSRSTSGLGSTSVGLTPAQATSLAHIEAILVRVFGA